MTEGRWILVASNSVMCRWMVSTAKTVNISNFENWPCVVPYPTLPIHIYFFFPLNSLFSLSCNTLFYFWHSRNSHWQLNFVFRGSCVSTVGDDYWNPCFSLYIGERFVSFIFRLCIGWKKRKCQKREGRKIKSK